METLRKVKILAGIYFGVLLLLLVCVSLTPLVIRHGISGPRSIMIEEETLETLLIVSLFGISYLLLRGLLRTLSNYRQQVEQTAEENATLLSRLSEAFQYIGTVNVEIREIHSVLCGNDCHPQSRREFRRCLNRLAAKAMAITGSPWVVVRVIDRRRCRTVKECAAERRQGALPRITTGNRIILEGRPIEGLATIKLEPKNLDLLTVCIMPSRPLADAEHFLLTAILNQFEMLLRLHIHGGFKSPSQPAASGNRKGIRGCPKPAP